MGASGAGKTTLLNVLTFRNRGNLTVTGSVKINGRMISDSSELASISAYVEQDDIFIGTLKVKEHIKFQAMLRMGRNATVEEKNARVEEILSEVIAQFINYNNN
jgi:ATP-binding cassette, subfamily G (WHITE), eye pigment precursor transporter